MSFKKKLALTALFFWAFVLLINLLRPTMEPFNMEENAFWAEKISWKNKFDIAITGDSRALIGISPEVLEEELKGYKFGNVAFAALIYSKEYLEYVRNSLNEKSDKKAIIICFSPRSLLSDKRADCYFRITKKENHNFIITEINRHASWLRTLFQEFSISEFKIEYPPKTKRRVFLNYHSGWMATRAFPDNQLDSSSQYLREFSSSQIDEKLLNKIFYYTKIWRDEGIKVFGLQIPASRKIRNIEQRWSNFDNLSIRERFEKNGGIWLEIKDDNLVIFDGSHIRYDSAVYYSRRLAVELKKHLSGDK